MSIYVYNVKLYQHLCVCSVSQLSNVVCYYSYGSSPNSSSCVAVSGSVVLPSSVPLCPPSFKPLSPPSVEPFSPPSFEPLSTPSFEPLSIPSFEPGPCSEYVLLSGSDSVVNSGLSSMTGSGSILSSIITDLSVVGVVQPATNL